jgi:lipopolysaccharide export LptBFGC system permease protein LptF
MAFGYRRGRSTAPRRRRNTAPAWKKFAVVLSAPVAVVAAMSLLHASTWSFVPFVMLVVAVAAFAVWLTSKLLGVHLSLGSWD